jgi:serine/threonine-protein kinase
MMNHPLKNPFNIIPGTVITGKWHRKQFRVIKELGSGANGTDYLAQHGNMHIALKMSQDGLSVTSEANVLKSFAKVQGSALGPSLLDVDDWESSKGLFSFYAMEYIEGPDLLSYIQQKGRVWTMVLILQLLNDLAILHEKGWVFGDLKPDNLIVKGPPARIRCIDVGGTTQKGRAIKEFTEFFDRGYWGLGTRKAEPTYDLFAVAMVLINTAYPERFSKTIGGIGQLRDAIGKKTELTQIEDVLLKALTGKFTSAHEMRSELIQKISGNDTAAAGQRKVSQAQSAGRGRNTIPSGSTAGMSRTALKQQRQSTVRQVKPKKQKKRRLWMETFFIFLAVSFLYFFYILFKVI